MNDDDVVSGVVMMDDVNGGHPREFCFILSM
jgi:hypothetical protein